MLGPDPAASPETSEVRTDDEVDLPEGVWEMNGTHIVTLVIAAVVGLGTVAHRFVVDGGSGRS